uniref:Uncharacterized protein n=1 Tax=viral metagenome TaxID=1070528 RepID=A0A6M3LSQ6_9ZZZZ
MENDRERRENIASKIREGLRKDYKKLYVQEYTTSWQFERIVRETELGIMDLTNTINQVEAMIKNGK